MSYQLGGRRKNPQSGQLTQRSSVRPTGRTVICEGNGYLVSWCVGHLVELAPPNVYDAKYVKWSIADLPILPEKVAVSGVCVSTKKQFGILQKLDAPPGCG